MKGRWPGCLLLLMAITAVIAGHGIFRAEIAGIAEPILVSAPPRPGDCVLSAPDPAVQLMAGVAAEVTAVFGPCGQDVVGEVVSVRTGPTSASDGSVGAIMGTSGDCWAAASRYTGLATMDGAADLPSSHSQAVFWRPDLRVRGQQLYADWLQRAAGRDWSACVVRPENLGVYDGSVRQAVLSGTAPAQFGDCSPSRDSSVLSWVVCSHPHPTERLGWAEVPAGSISTAGLQNSCREFAALLFHTSDPTFGNVLEIVAIDGDVTTCSAVVRGTAQLTSTLIGIGPGPLPLTT